MKKTILCLCMIIALAGGCSMESEKESKQEAAQDNVLVAEGIKALQDKDPVKAVVLFEKALAVNPENAAAYFLAGNVYLRVERYEDAIRVLAPGMKHLPNNGSIPYMIAIAFKSIGNPKQAFLAARRAEEIYEAWQQTEQLNQTRLLMAHLIKEIQGQEE